ncbi:MAG TPA: SDR family oxidoreductase [Gammaproteobacteria bacterium]|nr:SDR family oxidoreductase [Gammaproteobacteria bacterium]
MRLADRVVIVTGGAAGMGLAFASRLLSEGAAIVIADIKDPEPALNALGHSDRTLGLRTDVSQVDSVRSMIKTAFERFGRIDVLINNAAIFSTLEPRPFDEIHEQDWDQLMAVNVKGVWNCVREVTPVFRAQQSGRIINIASAVVGKGTALMLHYVASKGAVVAMTRALARELASIGVTVNAVAPGLILSDTVAANPAITAFQSSAVMQARSIKRDAYPEDVVGAVAFLASDDSAFMSGQTLIVDGGSVFSTL